jgi:hypothetical protein
MKGELLVEKRNSYDWPAYDCSGSVVTAIFPIILMFTWE